MNVQQRNLRQYVKVDTNKVKPAPDGRHIDAQIVVYLSE